MVLIEHGETNLNVKKMLKKLNWFKRYKDLNFEIPAILLLFLEIWQISTCNIFLINSHFKVIFKIAACYLSRNTCQQNYLDIYSGKCCRLGQSHTSHFESMNSQRMHSVKRKKNKMIPALSRGIQDKF